MEIGIDFGTTFSTLCFSPGRGIEGCVPESDTIYIPTAVGIRSDGTYTIGLGALQEPNLLVYRDIKRYFGLNKYNKESYMKRPKPSIEVVADEWGCRIGPVDGSKGKTRNMLALTCMFVSALSQLASKISNLAISVSVCSVPAEYNSYMRSFIYEGCKLANISVQAVVNEPTAAGLSAFTTVDKNSTPYMLVYDFGGGTFDASLLVVGPSYVCVIDSLGDNYLGGRDVDNKLLSLVSDKLGVQQSALDSFAMEALKIDVVNNPKQTERRLLLKDGTVAVLRITIEEFQALCRPLVEKARSIVLKLLTSNDVTSCVAVLVGGSSVLPGVKNSIASIGRVSRVIFDMEGYRAAVAIGAAIYAQTFSGTSRYRLIDCISSTLSDERKPLKAVTVFPKGHPIPAIVEVDYKMPSHNTGVVLHEGESSFINKNQRTYSSSVRLGKFKAGESFKQKFVISEDGRLTVYMNDAVLENVVLPPIPPKAEYGEKYVSSDDKRIKPEVNDVKLFYSKLLNDTSLYTADLQSRISVYKRNGFECD
nr:heat shock protein 70 [Blackberry dwarf-associated virus]